uniref:uncharacterized protein LOC117249726 n=1 Tax=Epinephelus lanceolatus TaxID=310571 RepID=UPI00144764A1|nr:uncharacterized protein LOC117249726 [Epinephelus lanceolatus]
MYCHNCGKEFEGKPNFCSDCGKRLQEDGDDTHAPPSIGELPDTSDSDSEIVIKTTSREFDLADTLPFEPHHKSSPVHKEPDKVNGAGGLSLSTEVQQTIHLDEDHTYPGTSGCLDVKSSCYRNYTNLFAPIVIDYDEEDEVLIPEETNDMPSEESEPTSVQAPEVIANLALAIDRKKVSRFNISRSDVWDGAVRGFRRSSYSENSDIFVKFTDDAGSFEEGLDTAVREDEYFLAGKMTAVSIIHGGPAPHFLSKDLVNHIIGKPSFSATVEDVTDEEIGKALRQVENYLD